METETETLIGVTEYNGSGLCSNILRTVGEGRSGEVDFRTVDYFIKRTFTVP